MGHEISAVRQLAMFVCCVATAFGLMVLGTGCAPKLPPPPEVSPPPVQPESLTVREILLQEYARWKGVPYRFGGTTRAGVDCSGLMQAVFRDGFNLALPRTSIEQSHMGIRVSRAEIQPGDLLFFSDRKSDHIGVAVGEHHFLQASTRAGVIISDLDRYWGTRLTRVSRILGDGTHLANQD